MSKTSSWTASSLAGLAPVLGLILSLAAPCNAATLDELVASQRAAMQRTIDATAQPPAPAMPVAPTASESRTSPQDDVRVAGIYGVGTTRIADVAIGTGPAIPLSKGKSTGGWVVVDIADAEVTLRKSGAVKVVPLGAPVTTGDTASVGRAMQPQMPLIRP